MQTQSWTAESKDTRAMQVADRFGMEWKLFYDNKVKRVAILVSRMDHCLYDILIRHRAGLSHAPVPLPVDWVLMHPVKEPEPPVRSSALVMHCYMRRCISKAHQGIAPHALR